MKKTTVYLPDELKSSLERVAVRRGISEAALIRIAVTHEVGEQRPAPRGALYRAQEPIAERVDDLLIGFGER